MGTGTHPSQLPARPCCLPLVPCGACRRHTPQVGDALDIVRLAPQVGGALDLVSLAMRKILSGWRHVRFYQVGGALYLVRLATF